MRGGSVSSSVYCGSVKSHNLKPGSSSNGFSSYQETVVLLDAFWQSKCALWRYSLTDCSKRLWYHQLVLQASGGEVLLV